MFAKWRKKKEFKRCGCDRISNKKSPSWCLIQLREYLFTSGKKSDLGITLPRETSSLTDVVLFNGGIMAG
jgi:hypothetical protein